MRVYLIAAGMATYTIRSLEEIVAAVKENAQRVHGAVIQKPDSNFSELVHEFAEHLRNGGGSDAQVRNNIATYLDQNPEILAKLQNVIGDRQVGFQGAGEHALALSVSDAQGNVEIIRITRAQEPAVASYGDVLRPSATANLGDISISHSSPAVSLEEFVQEGVINRGEADKLNNQHRADLYRDGLHNSDPHLDNTGVTSDGRVVVTDPGAIRTLEEERARVVALPEGSQKDAARQDLDLLEKSAAGPRVNSPDSHPESVVRQHPEGQSRLENVPLGGDVSSVPHANSPVDAASHAGGNGHSPHVKTSSAAGRLLGGGIGVAVSGVVAATTAGAAELVHGNGVAAAADAAGKAGAEAALDAIPGVNSVKVAAEGRDREANVRAWESLPIIGGVYGEIRRPMERYFNGAGEGAPDSRRVEPGFIESGITTAAQVAQEGAAKIANWWNGTSAQPQQATPSPAEKPNQPEQNKMATALAMAKQALGTEEKYACQSGSDVPPPSSCGVPNAKAPEQSVGVGHA